MTRDRRHPNKGPASARHHVGHCVLHTEHRPQNIELKHPEKLVGLLYVIGAHASAPTGIRHTAIEAPRGLEGRRNRRGHTGFIGHIRHDEANAPPDLSRRRNLLSRRLKHFRAPTTNRDRCAVGDKGPCTRGPDAGSAPRHQKCAAFQSPCRSRHSTTLLMIGLSQYSTHALNGRRPKRRRERCERSSPPSAGASQNP